MQIGFSVNEMLFLATLVGDFSEEQATAIVLRTLGALAPRAEQGDA